MLTNIWDDCSLPNLAGVAIFPAMSLIGALDHRNNFDMSYSTTKLCQFNHKLSQAEEHTPHFSVHCFMSI